MGIEVYVVALLGLTVFSRAVSEYANDGKLKLVQLVFRHGDRNPINPFPTYPYRDESFWPEGFGQLTKRGKMQHYMLGQFLRQRYGNFLNSTYSHHEISIRSSNIDRTIASAESNLAGLYPPIDGVNLWNPDIKWQPIPVHSEPLEGDRLLRMNGHCPKYHKLHEHFLFHSPEAKQLREQYREVFELLEDKTGREMQTAVDVDNTYDELLVANIHYNYWPEWAPQGSEILAAMHRIGVFSFQALAYTEEMQRLRGGPLVQELLHHFNMKIKGELDGRMKMLMYSGHDTTLAVLLNTMGVFDPQRPPYASAVLLELWEQGAGLNTTHTVKIFYRNETEREPYLLSFPGCPNPCSIQDLNRVLSSKIPVDWEVECRTFELLNYFGDTVIVMTVASLIVLLLVTIAIIVVILKNRRHVSKRLKQTCLQIQEQPKEQEKLEKA